MENFTRLLILSTIHIFLYLHVTGVVFFVDHYNIGIYVGMASYCDPHVYCTSVKSGTCYTLNKNMFDIHLLFLHVHLKLGFSYKMTRDFYLKNSLCN